MKFMLGQVVATPKALQMLEQHEITPLELIQRHVSGDFGDLCDDDREANQRALIQGSRIFSCYRLNDADTIWCITESIDDCGVRQSTCLLTPEEY